MFSEHRINVFYIELRQLLSINVINGKAHGNHMKRQHKNNKTEGIICCPLLGLIISSVGRSGLTTPSVVPLNLIIP